MARPGGLVMPRIGREKPEIKISRNDSVPYTDALAFRNCGLATDA